MTAAMKNGTPCLAATAASPYVPILFALSPFATMRSAPVMTEATSPLAMRLAAAVSGNSVAGIPEFTSSHAVSRAPCNNGRVSVAKQRSTRP